MNKRIIKLTERPFPAAVELRGRAGFARVKSASTDLTDDPVMVPAYVTTGGAIYMARSDAAGGPVYPFDSFPGLASALLTEATGPQIRDFVPASEFLRSDSLYTLERSTGPYRELCLGVICQEGMKDAFVVALAEGQMQHWYDQMPDGVSFDRVPVKMKTEMGEPPNLLFISQNLDGSYNAELASDLNYEMMNPGVLSYTSVALPQSGDVAAWLDLVNRAAWNLAGYRIDDRALKDEACAMAVITLGDTSLVLHAPDDDLLMPHLANAALEANKLGRSDFPDKSDEEILEHLWDNDSRLYIWQGPGSLRVAYGEEAKHVAVLVNEAEMPPVIQGFGASSEAELRLMVLDGLGKAAAEFRAAVDMDDLASLIVEHGGFCLHQMCLQDLESRIKDLQKLNDPEIHLSAPDWS